MKGASHVNAKNRKIIFILVAAILSAIIGGVAMYFFLMPQKTTVYVFNDNYKSGEPLTEDMLVPIQADSKITVAGKQADTSSSFVTGKDIETVLNAGDSSCNPVSCWWIECGNEHGSIKNCRYCTCNKCYRCNK